MKKRNLFAEISEGFEALAEERTSKRTLRTVKVETKPVVEVARLSWWRCAKACIYRARYWPVICARIRARWRTGSRVERNRTLKQAGKTTNYRGTTDAGKFLLDGISGNASRAGVNYEFFYGYRIRELLGVSR